MSCGHCLPVLLTAWAAFAAAASAVASQPRIVLEAEGFQSSGGWQAIPWEASYFCATFANDFLSRQACLRAPAQAERAIAQGVFRVPKSGDYALLARYACPYMHHVVFTAQVEQAGGTVGAHAFGRLQSPKLWPFGGGVQPMATYPWGGGDNMVWEQAEMLLHLEEGEAQVSLTAGPQPEPAAERQVDVLLLTPLDEEVTRRLAKWQYLPLDGLLTQAGDLFLRITNPEAGVPFLIGLTTTEHSPYWVHERDWRTPVVLGTRGIAEQPPAQQDYLTAGQSSPWVEVGSRVDRLNESTLIAVPTYQDAGPNGINAIFEFAVPRDDGGMKLIRRVHYEEPTAKAVRFAVPGNVRGEAEIRTAEEELEAILDYVRSLPQRGRTPEHVGIRGIFTSHFAAAGTSERLDDLVTELQTELVGEALDKGIEVESLGDEIGLSLARQTAETDEAFRRCLRAKGLSASDLLPASAAVDAKARGVTDLWSLVELNYDDRDGNPRTWYHSQVFGYENGSLADLAKETERVTRESNGQRRTGANYSPHPNYWPKESQWVRPFKLGALTMPWSEDYVWGIPELSPQVTGYLLDALRCGAKYRDLPICFYVMPHSPGNTPRDFRLSYYEALGHGTKLINNYCVTPVVTAYTENYVSANALPMYREVHDLARELGQFDDIIATGHVRPAQVALLISGTTDLWDPSLNYNHERKCLYYALRHAGIPVDLVTEDDIADGGLSAYRVLYISASHMLTAAADALAGWVAEGGILCSAAGGGLLDEYGEPNESMLGLFGLGSAELREHDLLVDTMYTLPRLRPADGIRLALPDQKPVALPALATTQRLTPLQGAQVVGWFHDETPAATLREVGAGQALLIGGFPGAAYVVAAIPVRPWDRGATDAAMSHFLPTEFDARAADVILWAVKQAGVRPDIRLSEPIVEWSAVDSPSGTAILLMNWTGAPVKELTVTVSGALERQRVESVQHGLLSPREADGQWQVTLPLGITDCITVRRRSG